MPSHILMGNTWKASLCSLLVGLSLTFLVTKYMKTWKTGKIKIQLKIYESTAKSGLSGVFYQVWFCWRIEFQYMNTVLTTFRILAVSSLSWFSVVPKLYITVCLAEFIAINYQHRNIVLKNKVLFIGIF